MERINRERGWLPVDLADSVIGRALADHKSDSPPGKGKQDKFDSHPGRGRGKQDKFGDSSPGKGNGRPTMSESDVTSTHKIALQTILGIPLDHNRDNRQKGNHGWRLRNPHRGENGQGNGRGNGQGNGK